MSNLLGQKELIKAVVKFVGDSGDGMQLTGTLFSDDSAIYGNDLATFPDYPAEIRAPHNTVAGVSGYQVHIGSKEVYTPGDTVDVLLAMNPASLKANLKWLKKGSLIITDLDAYTDEALSKAGYAVNPLNDGSLSDYDVVTEKITTLNREALSSLNLDPRSVDKTKNMYVLGMVMRLFNRDLEVTNHNLEKKFAKKPQLAKTNEVTLRAGYAHAEKALPYSILVKPAKLEKGKYRNITGNIATAWGLLAASEKSGRPLYLGSYPITPATDIMVEITNRKSLGARVVQAEDEIAGICSAIGASYGGSMAVTTTSGPGLSLKSEAIGLAVMTELPLVIVDVQRSGPSTGMPTKSEQSDLMQALYGRNGDGPIIIVAASSPTNCFYYAYEAARLSLEHMTPVMLLTDGYLGNGSQLFRIPSMDSLKSIVPPIAQPNDSDFKPYRRDAETLVRKWALPGTDGLRHRVGGLEKEDVGGAVSTDPINHEKMVIFREEKVNKVANNIPEQTVIGDNEGDTLVVGWGSTEGALLTAVNELRADEQSVSLCQFNYIMPLPRNTQDIFAKFKKILVCELNRGQFVGYLRMQLPDFRYQQFNKAQGQPFTIAELKDRITEVVNQ
jgi:2-oxoglutarate/2-oxoacid ferredoxin oxidoreductase subunit alpha